MSMDERRGWIAVCGAVNEEPRSGSTIASPSEDADESRRADDDPKIMMCVSGARSGSWTRSEVDGSVHERERSGWEL
jgi:hypothetical protein